MEFNSIDQKKALLCVFKIEQKKTQLKSKNRITEIIWFSALRESEKTALSLLDFRWCSNQRMSNNKFECGKFCSLMKARICEFSLYSLVLYLCSKKIVCPSFFSKDMKRKNENFLNFFFNFFSTEFFSFNFNFF